MAEKTRASSKQKTALTRPRVAIIMGSDSDLRVMKDAISTLKDLGVAHEVRIVSAHRSPEYMLEYAASAQSRGIQAIVAAAGGAAHLPGMVAACTRLPVVGVPIAVGSLDGMDALLSIAQMPKGVPVACMAINGAANGALFAVRIIALQDAKLKAKLEAFAEAQKQKVARANRALK